MIGKRIAAAIIVVLAGYALVFASAIPYAYNRSRREIEVRLRATLRTSTFHRAGSARKLLETIEAHERVNPAEFSLPVYRAVSLRILRRDKEAIQAYSTAYELNARPELLMQRGIVFWQLKQDNQAFDDLALAIEADPKLALKIPQLVPDHVLLDRLRTERRLHVFERLNGRHQ